MGWFSVAEKSEVEFWYFHANKPFSLVVRSIQTAEPPLLSSKSNDKPLFVTTVGNVQCKLQSRHFCRRKQRHRWRCTVLLLSRIDRHECGRCCKHKQNKLMHE